MMSEEGSISFIADTRNGTLCTNTNYQTHYIGTNSLGPKGDEPSSPRGETQMTLNGQGQGHQSLDSGGVSSLSTKRCCGCTFSPVLLLYKFYYVCYTAAIATVLPFIAIFLKQLGMNPLRIGVITGMRPVIGFISAPVIGCLADRYNKRKLMLIVSLLGWFGVFMAFFHIPLVDRVKQCPDLQPHRDSYIPVRQLDKRHAVSVDRVKSRSLRDVPNHMTLLPTSGESTHNHTPFLTSTQPTNSHSSNSSMTTSMTFTPTREVSSPSNDTVWMTPENFNGTWNLTEDQLEIIRENLEWLYQDAPLTKTFLAATLLIGFGELVMFPSSALFDTAVLQTLGHRDISWYGHQRAWGAFGWGASAFSAGALVSMTRHQTVLCGIPVYFSNYRILAYVFAGFISLTLIAASCLKFREDSRPEGEELKTVAPPSSRQTPPTSARRAHSTVAVLRVFANVHYGSWLCTTFFVGVCNGVIWGFLYWHLENLGASQLLMGTASVCMCLSEFIVFYLGDHILRRTGHINILYTGLAGYSLRFVIYAVIDNPWWVLPAEVLQGITFSLVWLSLQSYSAVTVPVQSLASMQGIVHGVYFGLGAGSGGLVGGALVGAYGARVTFYAFAAAAVVVLLFFIIIQKCSKRPDIKAFNYEDLDEEPAPQNEARA